MTPVGLDLSLTGTGVATASDELITIKTLSVMSMGERLNKILTAIEKSIAGIDEPFFFVEDVPFTRNNSAAQLGMVHGVVHLFAHQCAIPVLPIPAATLKKYGTGKGNATKPDMRMSLFKRAGVDLRDDNQVDAWWLWALGHELMGTPVVELPKAQLDHLIKIRALYGALISD